MENGCEAHKGQIITAPTDVDQRERPPDYSTSLLHDPTNAVWTCLICENKCQQTLTGVANWSDKNQHSVCCLWSAPVGALSGPQGKNNNRKIFLRPPKMWKDWCSMKVFREQLLFRFSYVFSLTFFLFLWVVEVPDADPLGFQGSGLLPTLVSCQILRERDMEMGWGWSTACPALFPDGCCGRTPSLSLSTFSFILFHSSTVFFSHSIILCF